MQTKRTLSPKWIQHGFKKQTTVPNCTYVRGSFVLAAGQNSCRMSACRCLAGMPFCPSFRSKASSQSNDLIVKQ